MNNNNSTTFRSNNEILFLVNILNTMYNDNLRQITSLTDMIINLNNSNNQIRTMLVQLLNRNQRRYENRRWDTNLNNIDYNSLTNGINLSYLIGEYVLPRNTDSSSRQNSSSSNDYLRNLFDNFLQPVEIYPTPSQIETATRRVRYCDISRPINTSCPISMDEFNDNDMVTVIRHCGHTFYTEHIMNWFRSNCRCPVCRYDIREYNSSNASNEFFSNYQGNVDSSNNGLERNSNQEYMNDTTTNYIDPLLNVLDFSGNILSVNNQSDRLSTFLMDVFTSTRNNVYTPTRNYTTRNGTTRNGTTRNGTTRNGTTQNNR
jgi:hypothetical protein